MDGTGSGELRFRTADEVFAADPRLASTYMALRDGVEVSDRKSLFSSYIQVEREHGAAFSSRVPRIRLTPSVFAQWNARATVLCWIGGGCVAAGELRHGNRRRGVHGTSVVIFYFLFFFLLLLMLRLAHLTAFVTPPPLRL